MDCSVVNEHRFDGDPDPNFHFDAAPDPDPEWHQNDADTTQGFTCLHLFTETPVYNVFPLS